jgi:hypothetical protein
MESMLLDVAGHRRSPATMPGYHLRSWREDARAATKDVSTTAATSTGHDCSAPDAVLTSPYSVRLAAGSGQGANGRNATACPEHGPRHRVRIFVGPGKRVSISSSAPRRGTSSGSTPRP